MGKKLKRVARPENVGGSGDHRFRSDLVEVTVWNYGRRGIYTELEVIAGHAPWVSEPTISIWYEEDVSSELDTDEKCFQQLHNTKELLPLVSRLREDMFQAGKKAGRQELRDEFQKLMSNDF